MPIKINSIDTLQEYLQGVLGRAGHHAGNVEGVSLALLGAVIWKSDGEITVRQYDGRPANMIWFQVNGTQYLMKYNHESKQIELLDRNNDNILHQFDNSTTYNQVIEAFNSL